MPVRALAGVVLCAAFPALACEAPSGAGWARAESAGHIAWLAPRPARPGVGAEFALEAKLCAKSGASPTTLRFDAWMPAHRHGMNTRTVTRAEGPGRWRAEGFLFHMPGAWQFVVELDTVTGRERLTHDLTVE